MGTAIYADPTQKPVCNYRTQPTEFVIGGRPGWNA
jgi:hypothetical protein